MIYVKCTFHVRSWIVSDVLVGTLMYAFRSTVTSHLPYRSIYSCTPGHLIFHLFFACLTKMHVENWLGCSISDFEVEIAQSYIFFCKIKTVKADNRVMCASILL